MLGYDEGVQRLLLPLPLLVGALATASSWACGAKFDVAVGEPTGTGGSGASAGGTGGNEAGAGGGGADASAGSGGMSDVGGMSGAGGMDAAGGMGGAGGSDPVVLETMQVSFDGAVVTSSISLDAGVTYRLRASGTGNYSTQQGAVGDAEYWDFAAPKTMNPGSTIDVGLGIDDPTVDGQLSPGWGPYRDDHIYEIDFVGAGAPIEARIHDGDYGNNTGSITLEILSGP